MLTDSQKDQLHQAIFDYLKTKNYEEAATAFEQSCPSLDGGTSPSATVGKPTVLEKKWVSTLRLQKKVLELESLLKRSPANNNHDCATVSSSVSSSLSGRVLPSVSSDPMKVCKGHRGGGITSVSIHPFQTVVATSGEDGTVKLWDWESGEFMKTLKGHTGGVQDVAFSLSGDMLASSSSDLSIKLWDCEKNHECTKTLRGHGHNIMKVRFLPAPYDGSLVSCSRDGTVKIWEITSGFCSCTLGDSESWIRALDVKCDGTEIAAGGNSNVITVYDTDAKSEKQTLRGHDHVINSIAYPPLPTPSSESSGDVSNNLLVSASRDKTVRVWNTATGVNLHTFTDHDNWVRDVLVHRSGNFVISVSDDKSVIVFDVKNKRKLKEIPEAHEHFVTAIAMHPKMPIMATGGVDNTLRLWPCS